MLPIQANGNQAVSAITIEQISESMRTLAKGFDVIQAERWEATNEKPIQNRY